MACMTPAAEGTRISIEDLEAHTFRASVIEWLMLSHPHDCPICDEGGECHLQDMTVMTGHDYRRYRGTKRTFQNQYLGPFINHEMNRCIQCYRCTRFYNDYAQGRDFGAFMLRNQVYFGRMEEGVLENEFSGNLVEVCPTGVFTDKSLKQHYTRKWDLQTAPSVCVHCALGCNTIAGERYGLLRRIRNRYNGEVNRYFLCDRGRYGYEFVNSKKRIRAPLMRGEVAGPAVVVSKEAALDRVARILSEKKGVIGIGSPRASLESNFALRTLVGAVNFCSGMTDRDTGLLALAIDILRRGPARSASLASAAQADAVLVLGEDVTNTAPLLALALRQSVRQKPMEIARRLKIPEWQDTAVREALQQERGPFYVVTPAATRLDEVSTHAYRGAPDDVSRLGFAVAHILSPSCPAVQGLTEEAHTLAEQIAADLKAARKPLIVSGVSSGSRTILQAAANVARALAGLKLPAEICLIFPECNSLGIGLMQGAPLEDAVDWARQGKADTVIVLENDLYRRMHAKAVETLFTRARLVIVLDCTANDTSARAEIALPAATFAEGTGTLVNNEGRAQRSYRVFLPSDGIRESWRWLVDIIKVAGRSEAAAWSAFDDVSAAQAKELPVFQAITEIAPPAGYRIADQRLPREPHRYSGRTAVLANIDVNEPKPPDDTDTPMSFSMEGFPGQPPSALIREYWAPGWNSVQALNKFQNEISGALRGGDPGRRLIEPPRDARTSYFLEIPHAFQTRPGEWLVVPLYHIFGSEELSIESPGIAGLAPEPYLGLNPADAHALSLKEGADAVIDFDGQRDRLPVRFIPSLPAGVAGVGCGLPGWRGRALPQRAQISAYG